MDRNLLSTNSLEQALWPYAGEFTVSVEQYSAKIATELAPYLDVLQNPRAVMNVHPYKEKYQGYLDHLVTAGIIQPLKSDGNQLFERGVNYHKAEFKKPHGFSPG